MFSLLQGVCAGLPILVRAPEGFAGRLNPGLAEYSQEKH